MEYYYLNITKNKRDPLKSYSRTLTEAFDKPYVIEMESRSHLKQHVIYLLCWTAFLLFIALTLGACGSPTSSLSTGPLHQETVSLNEQSSKTSHVTPPVFTYLAQEEIPPVDPAARPQVKGTVKLDPKRLLTLAGTIDNSVFDLANHMLSLVEQNHKPIDIVIASPGGSVSHGLMFIQAMNDVKAKGVVVRCFVTSMAASMAFEIFTQCQDRYSLPYSQLLFHAPRVQGNFVITPNTARYFAAALTQLETILQGLITPVMGIDEGSAPWFLRSYNDERLFLATDLLIESPKKWFTIVGAITGYPGDFPAPYEARRGLQRASTVPDVKECGR